MKCSKCGGPVMLVSVPVAFYKCAGTAPGCGTSVVKLEADPDPAPCPHCNQTRSLQQTKSLPRKFCTNPSCR
jgi:DNA-directed RNA polymerase subunit RPC12/RpoP